jgi:hypothetical protein
MMCERAGEVTAQTSSNYLSLGAIFRAYSKVRGYLLYPSKQLYNPQQLFHTLVSFSQQMAQDTHPHYTMMPGDLYPQLKLLGMGTKTRVYTRL